MSAVPRIDKRGSERVCGPAAATATLHPQREGVLHQLRRVDEIVQTTIFAKTVAHAFIAFHVASPTGAPVRIGKRGGPLDPERLEPLGFHAYERGGGRDQAIQNGMSPAGLRKSDRRLQSQRPGKPSRLWATGQARESLLPPEKYPKALAASAVDDSGWSNFPLPISLPGTALYMRSISCSETPERNRRTFMAQVMAMPTPRRRRKPFGFHPSTRPACISGKHPSRPETVFGRTFLGGRGHAATSIALRRSSTSRAGRVACLSLLRISVHRSRDSMTGAPRLQARHAGRSSIAGYERAIHSDVRDKTSRTCRIEGFVATQRKVHRFSISISSGGCDDPMQISERGRRFFFSKHQRRKLLRRLDVG